MIESGVLDMETLLAESASPGVSGGSMVSAEATPDRRSGHELEHALDVWERAPAAFPFDEAVAYYQSMGRHRVRPDLVRRLKAVKAAPGTDAALAAWLSMAVDQEDGTYSTYYGQDYLRHFVGDDTARTDAMITAVVAELAELETWAAVGAARRSPQEARARAATRLLTRLAYLAPEATPDRAGIALVLAKAADDSGALAAATARAAALAREAVPTEIASAVRRALVPTTRLHDELMFIRMIQVFEGMYQQVASAVSTAIRCVESGDGPAASRQVGRAADRIESVSALFRVLTTMPVDAFAVIRGYTSGRSAIQSEAYRRVIDLSGGPAEADGPTLEAAFLAHRDEIADAEALEHAMIRLDRGWSVMKRSHWGITLKIIGKVSGTGGTDGASYLRTAVDAPLFPTLTRVTTS